MFDDVLDYFDPRHGEDSGGAEKIANRRAASRARVAADFERREDIKDAMRNPYYGDSSSRGSLEYQADQVERNRKRRQDAIDIQERYKLFREELAEIQSGVMSNSLAALLDGESYSRAFSIGNFKITPDVYEQFRRSRSLEEIAEEEGVDNKKIATTVNKAKQYIAEKIAEDGFFETFGLDTEEISSQYGGGDATGEIVASGNVELKVTQLKKEAVRAVSRGLAQKLGSFFTGGGFRE